MGANDPHGICTQAEKEMTSGKIGQSLINCERMIPNGTGGDRTHAGDGQLLKVFHRQTSGSQPDALPLGHRSSVKVVRAIRGRWFCLYRNFLRENTGRVAETASEFC